ncbi:3-isopropylmalate dehydratase small subunit [Sphingomonas sp. RP10(2022)]|uniref:3-isopropylmalate dehydratase small subunit n=1 Tax=Sphingomonas liriopis TaxID=2949094 RepID=A0A9X2KQQ7_9SPHN|nr:3-isopropylmalate dehydratase small subunit [Sphingomonas liriopis]MCP3735984.1 3-isopropylmalate dehydratase small subunit [Sphingomonas liriopis]
MQPVTSVSGTAYPWGAKNIDTDIIIPAHWLKTITRVGLGRGAFETVRAQAGNVFDDPRYAGAPILIAGDNFGCGSSREHAAWALADMGVRAVIAPSFSDIFSGNAFKNGIVPVVLPQEAVDRLVEVAKDQPVTVDLETMTVTTPYQDRFTFELDPFRRQCLMQGLDEIGLTMAKDTAISKFEGAVDEHRPWIGSRSGYASIAVNGAGRT